VNISILSGEPQILLLFSVTFLSLLIKI